MPKASGPEQAQQEILEYVRKSEEAIIDAGRRWAAGIADLVPGDSEAIRKLINDGFDLTEAILKRQREFVLALLGTLRVVDGRRRPASRKKTPAPVRKRVSPGKSTSRSTKATKAGAPVARRRTSRA